MGKMIDELAGQAGDEIILKIDVHNRKSLTAEELQQADAAIEFTRPESAFENIRFSLQAGVPIVCGTTGWLDRLPEAKALCNDHMVVRCFTPPTSAWESTSFLR